MKSGFLLIGLALVASAASCGDGDGHATSDGGAPPRLTVESDSIGLAPGHGGARTDIARVELRAYRGDLGCATLDPDALPESPMAPRAVSAFGQVAEWQGQPADEGYTIVGWSVHAQSARAVGFGCAPVV